MAKPRAKAKRAGKGGRPAGELARIEKELAAVKAQQAVLLAALGLRPSSRKGDAGRVGALNDAVLKIQDYLLRTTERLDGILGTLKNHRELLLQLSQRIYKVGTRERIHMELDIMKNTLSIVALNGVEVDASLLTELKALQSAVEDANADLVVIRKSKAKLDRRFDGTVGKLDLTAIYRPDDDDLPGYG